MRGSATNTVCSAAHKAKRNPDSPACPAKRHGRILPDRKPSPAGSLLPFFLFSPLSPARSCILRWRYLIVAVIPHCGTPCLGLRLLCNTNCILQRFVAFLWLLFVIFFFDNTLRNTLFIFSFSFRLKRGDFSRQIFSCMFL